MEKELFTAINDYLEQVTEDNFSSMYDGLAAIIINYNKQGMGTAVICKAYNNYFDLYGNTMSLYQDEVFCEISACMVGFCTPYKQIPLLD